MKKTWLTVLTLLILAIVLLQYKYAILYQYNCFSAQWDIAHRQVQIIDYGPCDVAAAQKIAQAPKYGFKYTVLADYKPSTLAKRGIDDYNKAIKKFLSEQQGADWSRKYDSAVDRNFRFAREDAIREKVLKLKNVMEFKSYLDSISGGARKITIQVYPGANSIEPNVLVGEMMVDSSYMITNAFIVDPYTLNVVKFQY